MTPLLPNTKRDSQGELEITTEAGSGKAGQPGPDGQLHDHVERVPFLMLALDLPPAPLYKDALDKDIIPQVPSAALSLHIQVFYLRPTMCAEDRSHPGSDC